MQPAPRPNRRCLLSTFYSTVLDHRNQIWGACIVALGLLALIKAASWLKPSCLLVLSRFKYKLTIELTGEGVGIVLKFGGKLNGDRENEKGGEGGEKIREAEAGEGADEEGKGGGERSEGKGKVKQNAPEINKEDTNEETG